LLEKPKRRPFPTLEVTRFWSLDYGRGARAFGSVSSAPTPQMQLNLPLSESESQKQGSAVAVPFLPRGAAFVIVAVGQQCNQ